MNRWILALGLLLGFTMASSSQESAAVPVAIEFGLRGSGMDSVKESYFIGSGVSVDLVAAPGVYEIELRFCGVTHYFLATPETGRAGADGRLRWYFYDFWLNPEVGEAEIELRLYLKEEGPLGEADLLLLEKREPFPVTAFVDPSPEDRIHAISSGLAACSSGYADRLDPIVYYFPRSGTVDPNREREQAMSWFQTRFDWLQVRFETLVRLGEIYENQDRPGDALKLYGLADKLYANEASEVMQRAPCAPHPLKWEAERFTYGPKHWRALSDFHARRLQLEPAEAYFKKTLDFYIDQYRNHPYLNERDRERCQESAVHTMEVIAKLHYALRRDRAAHDFWIAKAAKGI